MPSPFKPGTRVQTTELDTTAGMYQPGTRSCRWGVTGTVKSHSDSHGLCYEVEHDDGTTAWYEPTEVLRLID